ncbi:SEL1-like repeat protein [Winogradskyella sp. MH6]|uniref:SEL1-like repeat protein n=1 Tax=Winogradskyella sp. MH6 TaxID=2929510 RepID=UPI001FB4FE15|nr:hypothetical protein [Winogradskyella sp. MH6]
MKLISSFLTLLFLFLSVYTINAQETNSVASKLTDSLSANGYYQSGNDYYKGNGVNQSNEKAFLFFKKAAEMGNSRGQYAIGYMYAEGIYVQQNYTKALEWFKKSEAQNNIKALNYLAHMYLNGIGVDQNDNIAFTYLKKLSDLGNVQAMYNVGLMYKLGKGVDENLDKAISILITVAKGDLSSFNKKDELYSHIFRSSIFKENTRKYVFDFIDYMKLNKPNEIDSNFTLFESEFYYNLGLIENNKENYVEATKLYKKAIDTYPENENANFNMATLMVSLDQIIVEEMNNLGTTESDDLEYEKLKLKRKKLLESAIPYYEKVMSINGNLKKDAINSLINIYSALKDSDKVNEMKKLLD